MKIVKNIIICDSCKEEITEEFFPIEFFQDKEMDPSGNGYNVSYIKYDICKYCANLCLRNIIKLSEKENNVNLIKFIKRGLNITNEN